MQEDTTTSRPTNRDRGRNALGPYGVVYRSTIERIPPGDTTAVALYALLVTYAHDGLAWPHQATLASTLGVSDRTVRTALATLITAGVLAKQPRLDEGWKIGNEYVILDGAGPVEDRKPTSTPERKRISGRDRTPTSGRNPLEQSLEEHTAPRKQRARDLLFDAVCEACGYDVDSLTRTEAGRVARACAELRQLSPPPSPEDVLAFGRTWRRTSSPGFACTPQTITGNWQRIMRADEATRRAERRRRNDMGVA